MRVRIKLSALRETRWHEYLLRFLFGGLITAVAGVIASHYGPVIGGLFLAFPAIFPASATLVEKHERARKERKGLAGQKRGRDAAAVDAAGAAVGSGGLLAFAAVVWCLAPVIAPWKMLALATLVWGCAAALAWVIRKAI